MVSQATLHAEQAKEYEAKGYYRNAVNEYRAAAYLAKSNRTAQKYRAAAAKCEDLIFTPANLERV